MSAEQILDSSISISDAISALTAAAQDSVDTDDYITYSTLLDIYLANPKRYSESERLTLLLALENILRENETLLSYVAWDLPVLLLPYLSSIEPFDASSLKSATPRKTALKIFNLIAEKGNAKEVFLKCIEALSTLDIEYSLDSSPEEQLDNEKLFVLKFYALFEVIISVTRRITTQYPSRFLTTSSTALLSFFSSHVDELSDQSLPVLLRRLYLFARDYVPPPSKTTVDAEEEALQRRMLQSYVTHIVEIFLRSRSMEWSKRYFLDIKSDIAVLPVKERQRTASVDKVVLSNVYEMQERFLQLTASFDMSPSIFQQTVLAEPPELELENDDEVDPSFPSPPTSADSIPFSAEGCFLLLAEFLISESRTAITFSFPEIISVTKRFTVREEGESPGAGVCDAIGFYGWRFLKDITDDEISKVSQEDFNSYLQILTSLSASSSSPQTRFLFHALVIHLLSRSSPERAYSYIYDTLQFCPFENVRSAFVIVLKDFINPGSNAAIKARITYNNAKQREVEDLIRLCLSDIENSPDILLDDHFTTFVAWVNNFLIVVPSEQKFLEEVEARIRAIIKNNKSIATDDEEERAERVAREAILTTGLNSLSEKNSDRLEEKINDLSLHDTK
ncbi:YAP-binding/ALF4/Glomulin [Lipomyces japonicus]|uniref:YAP-binding/ALF4/Glomulin n=1 Tax=Lipomyces japonicus TaxID=56871 RepID=UPI0034CFCCB8